jgi:hypothetical protein
MTRTANFRQHAEECERRLSASAGEHRDMMLNMAATLDQLAERRE